MNAIDEFELMAEVDEQSFAGQPRLNFGKLSMTSQYKQWQDKSPTDVTLAQFVKLDKKERSQEATFAIEIKEFNPDLKFTYERRVNVGGLDWNKIFKPSLFKVLGITPSDDKTIAQKQLSDALRKLVGAYVAVEDVPAHANKTEKAQGLTHSEKYNTIKVVAIYADRAECYGAWKSKYGGSSNGSSEVAGAGPAFAEGVPDGYTAEGYAEQKGEALKLYNEAYAEAYASAKGGEAKKIAEARKAGIAHAILEHFGENGATAAQMAELIGV